MKPFLVLKLSRNSHEFSMIWKFKKMRKALNCWDDERKKLKNGDWIIFGQNTELILVADEDSVLPIKNTN